ncbi:CHAP domain-containing protein [Phenylobacterium sp. J426]|uniref:CHAP domain-containing protein n=1 Tax=Phenylobacterium sp. J426 TaxID=2898439 RepID=UPI002151D095|nr:CHAP domain-containing protein [Phenylobacterium sp. J426]MCR5874125.1 CHAP domain-containing protein [Phenylobacterium sp. J426]
MRKRTRTLVGSLAAAAVVAFAPAGAIADTYWQCVPFARLISGIQIFGDARTWWGQASGKYETGFQPRAGAVLCFKPTSRMQLGHVAVVSQVLTERVVQITHANWSPIEGSRGKVEKDVTVVDVSANGDWSQVKVWYDPTKDLGGSTYPTHGFIYPDATAKMMAASGLTKVQNGMIAVAQSAASQMGAAVRPGSGPMGVLSQAADSTDRIAALIAAAARGETPGS